MKKIVFIVLMLAVLCGCDDKVETVAMPTNLMPVELQDCQAYHIRLDGSIHFVMRCPNSTTSTDYRSGKVTKRTVVIDGVEYEKVK